jgi:acetyltransferase
MSAEDRTTSIVFTKTGRLILIRPLRSTDMPLIEELFKSLSPRSIFFRFHGNLRSVPPGVIDCVMKLDRTDVAMGALEHDESEGRILGLCGIRRQPESETGEFTIVVRDEWQGIGVGARLAEASLPIARDLGMEKI